MASSVEFCDISKVELIRKDYDVCTDGGNFAADLLKLGLDAVQALIKVVLVVAAGHAIMRRVGDEMRSEETYRRLSLEPIEIFGVDNFNEISITIKARLKTQPSHQMSIGREYRRSLKKAFDAEGVEMPALRSVAARAGSGT